MFRKFVERARFFYGVSRRAEAIYALMAKSYREQKLAAERAQDPRKLAVYGFTGYSQTDEDGILQEIFRRIGTTNRTFVEFGCGDGTENNTTYLLLSGWRGLWMDGGEEEIRSIERLFGAYISSGQLQVRKTFITRSNINDLFSAAGLPAEIDLMSIDIDGNDYWVWEAMTALNPRVVVIEYNATFRPPVKVVQEYREDYVWDSSNFFGASLKALEELGTRRGYALVGCGFSGLNAYFVRRDLVGDLFSEPFTAENHYREPHYDAFVRGYSRHRRGIGRYQVL